MGKKQLFGMKDVAYKVILVTFIGGSLSGQ